MPFKIPTDLYIGTTSWFQGLYGNAKEPDWPNKCEKEELSCRIYAVWFQDLLLSYSNQDCILVKWTHRLIEQKRKSRNRLT